MAALSALKLGSEMWSQYKRNTLLLLLLLLLLLSADPIQGSPQRMFSNIRHRRFGSVLRRMPFLTQPTTDSRKLSRPFNVLGCTLEGNQLRHCAAKPIYRRNTICLNKIYRKWQCALQQSWISATLSSGWFLVAENSPAWFSVSLLLLCRHHSLLL